jgi:hypothetical protein
MLPTEGGQVMEQTLEETGQVKEPTDRRILDQVRVIWNEASGQPGQSVLRYTGGALGEVHDEYIIVFQTYDPHTGDSWNPKIINRADIQIARYMEEGEELEL